MLGTSHKALFALALSVALCASALAEEAGRLRKILVLDTNNFVERAVSQAAPAKNPALKKYVLARAGNLDKFADPQLFTEAMDWVASQWQHDGRNPAPDSLSSLEILKKVHDEGQRYRCVEYGKVLADLLAAMGHISRSVGMQSTDAAYGGWGRGHVATEVWSNELGKWIFLDPQFSVYAMYRTEFLNFHDMYLLKRQGKFGEIQFRGTPRFVASKGVEAEAYGREYADFLKNYFGFLTVFAQLDDKRTGIMLLLEGEQPPLVFQGGADNAGLLYTKDVGLAYPRINATRIRLNFDGPPKASLNDVMKEQKIASEEAYMANMWRFAPEGKFKLSLNSDMADLDHFEINRGDGQWTSATADTSAWSLTEGINTFEARAVDKRGVKGPVTFIKVQYQ